MVETRPESWRTSVRGLLRMPEPALLDEGWDDDVRHRRRPWGPLLVAVLVAILAVYASGAVAARMWRQDLDNRLLDAGAGTNAAASIVERDQLSAYRAIAYAEGFPPALARYDATDIERRLTPIDANHGIPMIDIIDNQGRVVFAFRASGSVRPIYRERRSVTIVRQALAGERDEFGERFTDLLATDEGPLLATAGPVRLNGEIVGALLLMTPMDQFIGRATNLHGAFLTAYSTDRGDPLATTLPIRPRALGTELRTRLADPARLPYATAVKVAGRTDREQIAGFVVRHRTVAFLGVLLPDRSRQVAWAVMRIVAGGMLVTSFLVGLVTFAWTRDRYVVATELPPPPPLGLPAGDPDPLVGRRP